MLQVNRLLYRKERGMRNKSISKVLSVILVATFLPAISQETEEHGKKWTRAIMFGKIDEVNQLIQAGIDVNGRFDLGISKGNDEIVDLLRKNGEISGRK